MAITSRNNIFFLAFVSMLLMIGCGHTENPDVDVLNDRSYFWHYRDIDSTSHYAHLALQASPSGSNGQAEALNNLAFVSIVRMDYDGARRQLDSIPLITDNQLELLVGYVQQMRLCQRRSANREFYDFREKALQCLQRIGEDLSMLTPRQYRRLLYAESEMAIVTSTYYYYVGLERQSSETMLAITPDVERDTAQFLNYLYNVGAGGIITTGTQADINQQEFDYLMRCFLLAQHSGCRFFVANALEAMTEHLIDPDSRSQIIADNLPAMKFINPDNVADEDLPLSLAQEALDIFTGYGDTYQIAGAYRTMASCFLAIDDYEDALDCLHMSLSDTTIMQAPDLVASIREQMSVAFAAIDNKAESDRNRNIYIDLQEQTRQDRQLEARAGQLEQALRDTSRLMWAVVAAIAVLIVIVLVYYMRRRQRSSNPDDDMKEREEQLREQLAMMRLRLETAERRHLEQRAKVSLVTAMTPLIDRIIHTIDHTSMNTDHSLDYIHELADEINRQNTLLTNWIQLRQGEVSLRIETFPLQELFDIVKRSEHNFTTKGITLTVQPTTASVKADRVLTLFMLNTLADNARKFTPEGGTVTIGAIETDDYVEISVSDTGSGIDEQTLTHIFDRKVIADGPQQPHSSQSSHGFGLLNCKGIIEKYRKMSTIFNVCLISAESTQGKGSRFFFRLPCHHSRRNSVGQTSSLQSTISPKTLPVLLTLMAATSPVICHATVSDVQEDLQFLGRAAIYADSAYFSNINGTYERTLLFADSCRYYLNLHYRLHYANHSDTLLPSSTPELLNSSTPPEIRWLHDSIDTNYNIILDIRNESAVAALALHQWSLYQYNNRIYTQLFKELSADNTLDDYCRKMQLSQTNRQVAVVILALLFICILAIVAWQFIQMFNISERRRQQYQDRLDMLADELQQLTLENNAFHVSNAVLDNTLSTLKHETMYYPSRILQATDNDEMKEIVTYYRELYGLLSAQSQEQVQKLHLHLKPLDHGIMGDENLIRFLFEILRRENSQQMPVVEYTVRNDKYIECRAAMTALHRTDLFTPSSEANIPWLLCRQIVRDHGEATGRRACAISAEQTDGNVIITITLPRTNNKTTK